MALRGVCQIPSHFTLSSHTSNTTATKSLCRIVHLAHHSRLQLLEENHVRIRKESRQQQTTNVDRKHVHDDLKAVGGERRRNRPILELDGPINAQTVEWDFYGAEKDKPVFQIDHQPFNVGLAVLPAVDFLHIHSQDGKVDGIKYADGNVHHVDDDHRPSHVATAGAIPAAAAVPLREAHAPGRGDFCRYQHVIAINRPIVGVIVVHGGDGKVLVGHVGGHVAGARIMISDYMY
mmetsp:Transcript_34214/g.100708  ORF Transcript_34214/g.100708 Transcript_34214/m.100708 type:complete len:234 (-) Transcript_34214:12-713(-)